MGTPTVQKREEGKKKKVRLGSPFRHSFEVSNQNGEKLKNCDKKNIKKYIYNIKNKKNKMKKIIVHAWAQNAFVGRPG